MKRRIRDMRISLALWIAPSLRPKRSSSAVLMGFTVGRPLQDVLRKDCEDKGHEPTQQ